MLSSLLQMEKVSLDPAKRTEPRSRKQPPAGGETSKPVPDQKEVPQAKPFSNEKTTIQEKPVDLEKPVIPVKPVLQEKPKLVEKAVVSEVKNCPRSKQPGFNLTILCLLFTFLQSPGGQVEQNKCEDVEPSVKSAKAFSGVHTSKFRHLKGVPMHKNNNIENIRNLSMSTFGECDGLQVNREFVAFPLAGPGGQLAVLQVSRSTC